MTPAGSLRSVRSVKTRQDAVFHPAQILFVQSSGIGSSTLGVEYQVPALGGHDAGEHDCPIFAYEILAAQHAG